MNRFLSKKFRFFSFVCIALLVFVHGYNLQNGYLLPYSLVEEPLSFTTFFEYFLANSILRFRIPMLFIISGYIFALKDNKPYFVMVKKRFVTLIIPYLIWSAVGLLVTYLLQQFTVTAGIVHAATIDQLRDERQYNEIGWHGILFRWLLAPTSFQLWFIRALFFYNILYPVFRWGITKIPVIWLVITFLLWASIFNVFIFEGSGLFFFSVGIWLQKTNFVLDRTPEWYSAYLSWLFFVGLSVIRTFMAFELEEGIVTWWVMTALYAATVIAGLLAVWFSLDTAVNWCMDKRWFLWLTSFSFIIFGMHVPLIEYITVFMCRYMHSLPNYRFIVYILAPLTVLGICIFTGVVLKRFVPKFYHLATGGRGL